MKKVQLTASVNLVNIVENALGLKGTIILILNGPGGQLKSEYEVDGEDEEAVYRKMDKLYSSIATRKNKKIVKRGTLSNVTSDALAKSIAKDLASSARLSVHQGMAPGRSVLQRERTELEEMVDDEFRKQRSVLQRERKK